MMHLRFTLERISLPLVITEYYAVEWVCHNVSGPQFFPIY